MAKATGGKRERRASWVLRLAGMALTSLGLVGCSDFWETVSSNDFEFRNLFTKPNPLEVLRDSNDGDKRAAALRSLPEPKSHGGNDQDQDTILQILTVSATTDKQPLCRLAAIETLGKYKDPRAVQALKDAFYNAGSFAGEPHSSSASPATIYGSAAPTPEIVTRIQCQALTALGETANPASMELLVRVLREPRGEGEQENQQAMDRRVAATRALAKFKSPEAGQALVEVIKTEKNVALRDQAYESYAACTGQKYPRDPKESKTFFPGGKGDKAQDTQMAGQSGNNPKVLPASLKQASQQTAPDNPNP